MKVCKPYLEKPLLVVYLLMLRAWIFLSLVGTTVAALSKGSALMHPSVGFPDGVGLCAFHLVYVIAHQGGTVHLLNQMDGFHDFISTRKSMNPPLKIQGC